MVSPTKKIFSLILLVIAFFAFSARAQVVNVDANKLLARVAITLSPRSGSFVDGSTFQVPILVDTNNRSINGIEVRINFDKNKLQIVNPTGGTSIIGVWVEPPGFDNTKGTASYVGVIPDGITTEAGLVGTVTFKAKSPGKAGVSISSSSKILLNDGLGTTAQLDLGRAEYSIVPKAPEGVQVYSETHPTQSDWYNNNSPVISWIKDPGVLGFSFVLDNQPNTIPDNVLDTEDSTQSYADLSDGLHYFHIKAIKDGVWGNTGHFLFRIDTNPPAEFKPKTDFLVTAVVLTERTLVSFFTTDNLSGVDYYEVGVIDKSLPATASPVFIQAENPFQVPLTEDGKLEVIVRAVDKAGNVRDASVDVEVPFVITKFVQEYLVYILIAIIFLSFAVLIIHYLVGHHIIRYIGHIRQIIKREEIEEEEKRLASENNNISE